MTEKETLSLRIKDAAKELISNKITPDQFVLLTVNDGSNKYSKVGGTCTIGTAFQLVALKELDPNYTIKIDNNMGLKLYTSPADTQYLEHGLVLNAHNSVLALSSDEGVIDGAMTLDTFTGGALTKKEMKDLNGKTC